MSTTPRRSWFAVDLILLGYLSLLTLLVLLGIPGRHTLPLLLFLGIVGPLYLVFQRCGVAWHDASQSGRPIPLWLHVLNLIYLFAPLAIVPLSFLKLGFIMEDLSLIVPVTEHSDFVQSVRHYDPDHALGVGLGLGPYGAATAWDHTLKNADIAIFGVYLPAWARQFHQPWLTGVMQFGYLFYYLAPVFAMVPLAFQRRWREFRVGSAMIAGCILSTYVAYLVVPATGPRFEGGIEAWLPKEPGWFGAEALYRAIDAAETFRWDAFPSGHVAVSIVCLLVTLRFNRRLGYFLVLPVALLCVSTVYMGYHYGVDVLGGIAFAIVAALVIPRFVRHWEAPMWKA